MQRSMLSLLPGLLLAISALGGALGAACSPPSGSAGDAAATASTPPPRYDPPKWQASAAEAAIREGKEVLSKHQCNRCHQIDDLAPPARPLHCTGCHTWMEGLKPGDGAFEKVAAKTGPALIERYQKNIVHLVEVPNLTRIAARVRPDWLATYLKEPWDVRPALEESMIRHKLSEAEQRAVVRYFAAVADADDPYGAPTAAATATAAPSPPPDAARLALGKQAFREKGCAACHTFGNVDFGVSAAALKAAGLPAALAPNLRFVRDRTRRDVLVSWIVDPTKISPTTRMPASGVDRATAELLGDYLLFGDPELRPAPPAAEPAAPALLDREVTYAEMKEEVLGKICVHCHMNAYEKDPGPGNSGGLGYAGVGLMMRTYEALVGGSVGPNGERRSVLEAPKGEKLPPIVRVLLERREEERRDHVEPFADHERPSYPSHAPAMPMGLPSMTDRQVSLLATWIAQGCQGPTEVTGKPGFDDGFLVPDGPIEKNKGCEARAPSKKRPAWAVDSVTPGVSAIKKEGKSPAPSASGRPPKG